MSILVDESEPIGEIEPPFESRDVQIRRANVRDFFELDGEIGRGKFGTVFKCSEKATGLRLAAKFIQVPKKADRLNVEREVEIMKVLRSPRLIQLYDAFDDGKKEICLLLELIEGGELFERVIDDDFILTERACAIFMRQICEGIQFMHLQHVLHLDLKPENILCLTRAGNRIKLIDFGLARRFDPSKKLQVLFGTPEFVAPEVVNFEQIGFGTDMWSVGIICYVLLSGLSPFMGETDVETMANVTIAKYDFDDEAFNDVSAESKDFISKLLVKSISKRLTATECLRHPWLQIKPLPPPVSILPVTVEPTVRTKEENEPIKVIEESMALSQTNIVQEPKTNELIQLSETSRETTKDILPKDTILPKDIALPKETVPPPRSQLDLTSTEVLMVSETNKENHFQMDFREESNNINNLQTKKSTPQPEEILQLTKTNLKQFVERWSSHPNSPFLYGDGSRRTTISLISPTGPPPPASWSQVASRASLSGMSPSAPSSVASPWISPTLTDDTFNNSEGLFNHYSLNDPSVNLVGSENNNQGTREIFNCKVLNHLVETESTSGKLIHDSDASNNNNNTNNHQMNHVAATVDSAIEMTSTLLKSVTETLLRLENGTAVKDRTGARVWERSMGAPPTAAPNIFSHAPADEHIIPTKVESKISENNAPVKNATIDKSDHHSTGNIKMDTLTLPEGNMETEPQPTTNLITPRQEDVNREKTPEPERSKSKSPVPERKSSKSPVPERRSSKSPTLHDYKFGNGLVHVVRKTETYSISNTNKFKGFSLPEKKPRIPPPTDRKPSSKPSKKGEDVSPKKSQPKTEKPQSVEPKAVIMNLTSLNSDIEELQSKVEELWASIPDAKEELVPITLPPDLGENLILPEGDWEVHPPVAARTMGISKRHKGISSSMMSTTLSMEESLITEKEHMSVAYSVNSVLNMETQL